MATLGTILLCLALLIPQTESAPASDLQEKKHQAISQQLQAFNQNWSSSSKLIEDGQFFHLLDTAKIPPALHKAVQQQDWTKAKQLLLQYYRVKFPALPKRKAHASTMEVANQALQHYFKGNKTYPATFRGVKIDWSSKAKINGKEVQAKEWLLQYHRLHWWNAMARAFQATENDTYFHEWRYQMYHYAKAHFPIHRNSPKWVKRGMESTYRCHHLLTCLKSFIHHKDFDADTLISCLYSLHHQTQNTRKRYPPKGNHLIFDLDGVLSTSLTLPEFKHAKEWQQEILRLYPALAMREVFSDGMNKELIFSYHTMYIGLYAKFYQKLKDNKLDHHLPKGFHQVFRKMHEIYIYQAYPDGTICQFGDAWKKSPGTTDRLLRKHHARNFPNDPFFRYMLTAGKESKPQPPCKAYPESGFYFFRSHWHDKDAVFMPVKSNKTKGAWHNHIDNGTFGLYAYGRNFMNDSGCYIYGSSNPKDEQWRQWFSSSKVHQTLTLDGKNIQLNSSMLHWNHTKELTSLVIENQSYPNLKHRRTILFVDNRYFVIHDQAIGTATGELRLHFQMVPSKVQIDSKQLKVHTQFPTGANLHVLHQSPLAGVTLQQEEGWISYINEQKEKRPAWALCYQKRDTATASFITILTPTREAQKASIPKITLTTNKDHTIYHLQEEATKQQVIKIPRRP